MIASDWEYLLWLEARFSFLTFLSSMFKVNFSMSLDLPLPKFLSLSTLKVLLYHGGGRGSQGFLRSF